MKTARSAITQLTVAAILGGAFLTARPALAQLGQLPGQETPAPETPARQAEMLSWLGAPSGEDIAIMATEFAPQLLPGITGAEMATLFNAARGRGGESPDAPLARLWKAVQQGDAEAVRGMVELLARPDSKDAAAQFLGGLWAEVQQADSPGAIEWFLRARDLVADEADKSYVDRYILGSASLAEPGQLAAREAGIAAAQRLAASFWNQSGGTARALADLLAEFDESESAEAVLATVRDAGDALPTGRINRPSSASYREVVNLLAAGDEEAALRMAVAGVQSAVATFVQAGSLDNVNYNDRQLVQFVAAYGLGDAVLEKLAGATATDGRVNHAVAAEMLNRPDIALPAYRELIGEDPGLSQVRWRLVLNGVGTDEARRWLDGFPADQLPRFGTSLASLLQQEQDFFRRLEIVELIRSFLDSADPDTSGNLGWAANVLAPLADSFYSDDVRITGVHQTTGSYGYENEGQRARSEEAAERQRSLHARVCESMLRHPSLAPQAFASISGFAGMPGARTVEEFDALARALVRAPETPDERFFYTHSGPSPQVPRLTPAQFLFRQAVDSGSMQGIDDEIIPLAESAGKPVMAGSMKIFSALFGCAPESFVEVATAIVGAGVEGVDSDTLVNFVQSAAQQRGIAADLGPLVLSMLRGARDTSGNIPYSARNLLVNLYGTSGAAAARDFLDGVAEIYLGPASGRKAFVTEHYQRGYRPGQPSGRAYAFKAFLETFSSPMGLAVIAAEMFMRCGYDAVADNNMANRFENAVRSHRFDDDFAATSALLDESPWLRPVDQFEVWPMPQLSEGSCYGHVIRQMRESSSSVRERMLAHVRSVLPETFGRNLTLACFEDVPAAAVSAVFAKNLGSIRELAPGRQKELADWYQRFISEQGGSPSMAEARAVEAWVAKVNGAAETVAGNGDDGGEQPEAPGQAQSNQGADPAAGPVPFVARAFLAAQTPAEASSSTVLHQHVLPVLVAVADDPELSARVFAHYRKLAAMPGQAPARQSQEGESFDSQLLAAFVSQIDPGRGGQGGSFAPLVAIFSSEAGRPVLPGPGLSALLASTFSAARSDVSPGVGRLVAGAADPLRDTVAALLLAGGAQTRGRSVYGTRLASLASLASANGWNATAAMLAGYDASVAAALIEVADAPPGLRLLAAGTIPDDSPEITARKAKLMIDIFDQGGALPPSAIFPTLPAFVALGEERAGAGWRPTARRLLHAAVRSLVPGSVTPGQFVEMLDLAAQTGYSRKRVQLRFGPSFAQQPWLLAMLVKHGQFAEARRLLRSRLSEMQMPEVPAAEGTAQVLPTGNLVSRSVSSTPDGNRRVTEGFDSGQTIVYIEDAFGNRTIASAAGGADGPVTFDASLAAAIPRFTATLDDPDLALLAELILLATPDPAAAESPDSGVPRQVGPGIRERMIAAASRRADVAISNPFLEERILSLLAPIAMDSEPLLERVAAYGRKVDVVALAMFEDEAVKQPRQRIFKAYLDLALVQAPADFGAIMEALLTSGKRRDHRVSQALQFYGSSFPDVLFQAADGFDSVKAVAYIPVFRRLLEVGGANSAWPKRMECLNAAIVCHVLAGRTEAFAGWFAELDPYLRETFRAQLQLDRLLQLAMAPLASGRVPVRDRVAMLDALFSAELFPAGGAGTPGGGKGAPTSRTLQGGGPELFATLVEEGIVPAKSLLEFGPRWAERNPRDGFAWAEIAGIHTEAEQVQEALDAWVQAVMGVPFEDRERYTAYHLNAASLLLQLDRVEPALTWFEFFNRGRLSEGRAPEFDALFRQTRFKVMTRQGRTMEVLASTLSDLQRQHGDADAWYQLGSVFDALGRRRMTEGKPDEAVPMLEVAFLALHKAASENPALDNGEAGLAFEALLEARQAAGELGDSVTLVPKLSQWRYFYAPAAAGSGWEQPGFDDSDWPTGAGQLGYGDGDEATTLDWGSNPEDKPITAYFRKAFEAGDPGAATSLAIDLLRDDGAVVYLNGVEVRRDNLPEGRLAFATEALESPARAEENQYRRTTLSPEALRVGRNVVAVEVHQNDPDSSDLSFDLQLKTNVPGLEDALRTLDMQRLRERFRQSVSLVQLEDWFWDVLDAARQPRRPALQFFENGATIELDGGALSPEAVRLLIESRLREQAPERRQIPVPAPRPR